MRLGGEPSGIVVSTTSTVPVEVIASWTAKGRPYTSSYRITASGDTKIIPGLAEDIWISIRNDDATLSHAIEVRLNNGVKGTIFTLIARTLLAGELLVFDGGKWVLYTAAGVPAVTENASDASPKFAGLRVGDGSNYTEIESDGTVRFVGNATVWQDVDFPIIIRSAGAGIPALQTLVLGSNLQAPQWAVNDYVMCEGQELPHMWKEGSTATWHIHVITNGLEGSDKYLRFEVEYTLADFGEKLATVNTTTSADLLIPANTADGTHLIFTIGTLTLTNYKIGAHVYARLKRVAAVGAAPAAAPFCSMLQLHIECDTFGSRLATSK